MKTLKIILLLTIILPAISLAQPNENNMRNKPERPLPPKGMDKPILAQQIENRENVLARIRERMASSTDNGNSTNKKSEQMSGLFEKQKERLEQAKNRLVDRELKVIEVIKKIAEKIQSRIDILEGRGLNMTEAKAKLAEAQSKIDEMITKADDLTELIATEITEENKDTILTQIKETQTEIKTSARATHALLVETIKEITKVLPRNGQASSTATTTN